MIDADGLNTLARMDAELLRQRSAPVILTPHLKEFQRLCGVEIEELQRDPVNYARDYAARYGVCVLLKGACTIVTDGRACVMVDRGCSGMATAGSGDVLSGVLVGLLGYAEPTVQTVAAGAYLTGLAGELAEDEINSVSMLASDTVRHIPCAVSRLMEN